MNGLKESKLLKLKPKGISLKKVKHKKGIAVIIVIAVVGGLIGTSFLRPKDVIVTDYVELTRGDIVKNVNTLGNVESNDKTNVYSTLSNVVKEVKVEVGDKVNAGDVLCVLDSSELERSISESTKNIAIDKEKAKLEVESKKQAYDNAAYLYNNNINSSISDCEQALETAKIKLDDAQNDYDRKKTLYDNGAGLQSDLESAESELKQCKSQYDKAVTDLESAKVKTKQEIDDAKNQYDSAMHDYNNNKEEVSLQGKIDDLKKCIITAPVGGTITAVNTSVGSAAQGVLFTIENLDDPVIVTNIKEVDVNKIVAGQEAEVTTDATPDEEFALGKVVSLSDAVNEEDNINASGNSNGSNSSASTSNTFEARIKLDNPTENNYIKVGMSAKANIILEKKTDVFSISFSSILEEDEGKFIKIARENADGKYEIVKIPVETGLENDTSVEIESSDLQEGDKVLLDPSLYEEGQVVILAPVNGGVDYE